MDPHRLTLSAPEQEWDPCVIEGGLEEQVYTEMERQAHIHEYILCLCLSVSVLSLIHI